MLWLISQIAVFLLIAAIIGFLIGWLMRALWPSGRARIREGELEAALERASSKIANLEAGVRSKGVAATAAAEQEEAARRRVEELEAALASLDSQRDADSGEVRKLQAELEAALGSVSSLRNRVADLQEDAALLAALTAERDAALRRIAELEAASAPPDPAQSGLFLVPDQDGEDTPEGSADDETTTGTGFPDDGGRVDVDGFDEQPDPGPGNAVDEDPFPGAGPIASGAEEEPEDDGSVEEGASEPDGWPAEGPADTDGPDGDAADAVDRDDAAGEAPAEAESGLAGEEPSDGGRDEQEGEGRDDDGHEGDGARTDPGLFADDAAAEGDGGPGDGSPDADEEAEEETEDGPAPIAEESAFGTDESAAGGDAASDDSGPGDDPSAATLDPAEAEALRAAAALEASRRFRITGRVVPDDLKRIHGVGPVLERMLNRLNIYTFRQIAELTEEDVDLVSAALGGAFPDRIRRDDWVAGAQAILRQERQGGR